MGGEIRLFHIQRRATMIVYITYVQLYEEMESDILVFMDRERI